MTTPAPARATADDPHPSMPRRRRRWIGLAVLAAVVLLTVVLLWFEPQALLFDTVVEDDFPAAETPNEAADALGPEEAPAPDPAASDDDAAAFAGTATPPDEPASTTPDREEDGGEGASAGDAEAADPSAPVATAEPVALATGSFGSRNRYTVTGEATAYELPDATRILRLEGFESTNGPDLFVYLTVGDTSEVSDAALAAEYVDLGALRGNVGDQNYAIAPDVDLARYDTVVIWCRRFATAFGASDLR